MAMESTLLISAVGGLVVAALLLFLRWHWPRHWAWHLVGASSSPLRRLPGPPSRHWLYGALDMAQMAENKHTDVISDLTQEYGRVWTARLPFFAQALCLVDTAGLRHVLTSPAFEVPASELWLRRLAFGGGLAISIGDEHRRQRRVLRPAFGEGETVGHYPVIADLCGVLVQRWKDKAAGVSTTATIDVQAELELLTLDILGRVAFAHRFDGLQRGSTKLGAALCRCWRLLFSGSPYALLRLSPLGRLVVALGRLFRVQEQLDFDAAYRDVTEVARELVCKGRSEGEGEGEGEGTHVLSLILGANLPHGTDVVGMVTSLVIGGHDTVAMSAAWALLSLARHTRVQDKLRHELFDDDKAGNIGWAHDVAALAALPYLDAVVSEALRMHAVAALMQRVAREDTVVPLSSPVQNRDGAWLDCIAVQQGDIVLVPIHEYHIAEHVWGADAREFRPERWLDRGPDAPAALTFSAGPRNCLGARLACIELRAIVAHVVAHFRLAPAVDAADIGARNTPIQRPVVEGQPGFQLPLRVVPL